MKPSIAIIGAGTAGTGAALRAIELNAAEVTLIEREATAAGSSGRSAAIYNVQTTDPLHIELRMRARELFFRLERDHGLPLHRIGNVRVAWSEEHLDRLRQVIDIQRGLGLTEEDSILLDRKSLQELVPDLTTDDLAGGLFGPNDGVIDGAFMCRVLKEMAVEGGLNYLQATLTGHTKLDNGRHRLETTNGTVEADIVINAGGAWADQIGEFLGHRVPVRPQVHDIVKVKLTRPLKYTMPMVNLYMPGSEGEALYVRQFDDTTFLAGFHTYEVLDEHPIADPDNFRSSVQQDYMDAVEDALNHRLTIPELKVEPGWTGLYPLSPDGGFILGPQAEDPSVITCTGLGGVGITSGAIAGFTAVEWALQGKPTTVPGADVWVPDRASLKYSQEI